MAVKRRTPDAGRPQRGLACGSMFGLAMEKGAAPTLATK
jgi:hypothetical protein